MRTTHTIALLEVPQPMYELVFEKMRDAGYAHAFTELDGRDAIDMHGIGLTPVLAGLDWTLRLREVQRDEVDEDPQPVVDSPEGLSYDALRDRLLELFPGYAPKGYEEHKRQALSTTDEQLVVQVEYMRRNMQWGCDAEAVTSYEQAMRNVWLPELLKRFLEETEARAATAAAAELRKVLGDVAQIAFTEAGDASAAVLKIQERLQGHIS